MFRAFFPTATSLTATGKYGRFILCRTIQLLPLFVSGRSHQTEHLRESVCRFSCCRNHCDPFIKPTAFFIQCSFIGKSHVGVRTQINKFTFPRIDIGIEARLPFFFLLQSSLYSIFSRCFCSFCSISFQRFSISAVDISLNPFGIS